MHYALSTMHYELSTMHYARCTVHYAISTMHYALSTLHYELCTVHYALCTLSRTPPLICTSTQESILWPEATFNTISDGQLPHRGKRLRQVGTSSLGFSLQGHLETNLEHLKKIFYINDSSDDGGCSVLCSDLISTWGFLLNFTQSILHQLLM